MADSWFGGLLGCLSLLSCGLQVTGYGLKIFVAS
jgi:hypothetical protein